MNRRGFIAGLLASSAAVPPASAFARDMGVEPVMAWDIGADDTTAVYVATRSTMSYALPPGMWRAAARAFGADWVERLAVGAPAPPWPSYRVFDMTREEYEATIDASLLYGDHVPADDVLLYGGPAPTGAMRQPDDEPDTGGDPRPAGDL